MGLVRIIEKNRAGEIDEAAYKVAAESCKAMQKRNAQETDDLSKMLKAATEPLANQQQAQQQQPKQQIAKAPVQTAQATAE